MSRFLTETLIKKRKNDTSFNDFLHFQEILCPVCQPSIKSFKCAGTLAKYALQLVPVPLYMVIDFFPTILGPTRADMLLPRYAPASHHAKS